jgi:hypothetical protein
MRLAPALLLSMLAIAGCTQPGGPAPSLAPRPEEAIDPRLPVEAAAPAATVEPTLAARLSELVAQARAGDSPFCDAADAAERLVATAGERQSESWIAAQQALSAAVAAREPTTRALGEIDALGATRIQQQGGINPADRAAIEAAAAEVGAIDRAQAARIEAMQARLGG